MVYDVALDARVLLPRRSLMHIVLLNLVNESVYRPLWSAEIMDDLRALYREAHPQRDTGPIERIIECLEGYEYGHDALVEPHSILIGNDQVYEGIAPHASHVLDAAVRGGADAILTTEPLDYPKELTDELKILVQSVDEFLCGRLELSDRQFTRAFDKWTRQNWDHFEPPLSVGAIIQWLEPEAPQFAQAAREVLLPRFPDSFQ